MPHSIDLRFLPFKQVHISQAQFAFNLLGEIDFNKSVVISPISISITLGMALLGAKNETAEEIRSAIAKDVSMEDIHKNFSSILETVAKTFNVIKMANKIYCIDKLKIVDEYKNGIQENYGGNFQLIDFIKKYEAADEINKFIASSTDNEIQNIVEPEMFGDSTAMILINALKFDGKWLEKFELLPNKFLFYSSPDSTTEVFMMEKEVLCCFNENDEYEMIEIPYDDKIFSMFIILPKKRFGLSEILQNIDVSKILLSTVHFYRAHGTVIIPKFSIDSSFDLSTILNKLNIIEAFKPEKADFSGIGNVSNKPIYISKVLQKASINVDENGTTAAAASALGFRCLSSAKPPLPFKVIADHPFIYFIADKNQNIYFIGTFCGEKC